MNMLEPYNFFFELPLYTRIEIKQENEVDFLNLMAQVRRVDGYNPSLKENTTYNIKGGKRYPQPMPIHVYEGFIEMELECVRDGFTINYYLLVLSIEDEKQIDHYFVEKVGQSPSIATLQISKLKEYDKVIDTAHLKEVARAIGLAANGVGIGSFVYLRRVFEFLVEESHQAAKNDREWDEGKYQVSRMVEKIEFLRQYLPPFLVANKSIYSILSVGIHELDEQECLAHFEALKAGIELILDEKVEAYKKHRKIQEAQNKIKSISQQIKKQSDGRESV